MFNFKRIKSLKQRVTREIRQERRQNFQQFIGCLPKDQRLNTTNYMLQKQIRNFDVKRLSFKNT